MLTVSIDKENVSVSFPLFAKYKKKCRMFPDNVFLKIQLYVYHCVKQERGHGGFQMDKCFNFSFHDKTVIKSSSCILDGDMHYKPFFFYKKFDNNLICFCILKCEFYVTFFLTCNFCFSNQSFLSSENYSY